MKCDSLTMQIHHNIAHTLFGSCIPSKTIITVSINRLIQKIFDDTFNNSSTTFAKVFSITTN